MFKPRTEFNFYFVIAYAVFIILGAAVYGLTHWWLYAYFIHFIIFSFGLGYGYHRTIIHRAVDSYVLPKRIAATVAIFSNTGSAITWGASHYLHHARPDTEADPHSPQIYQYKILTGFYSGETIMKSQKIVFPAVRHIARDKYLVFLHRYFYLIIAGTFSALFLAGGLKAFLFLGIIPSGLSYYGIICTNYFNHVNIGYRNFASEDHSNNLAWLWFLTFGENWHNNHHRYASSKTTRVKWWEFDPISFYCTAFDRNTYSKLRVHIKKFKLRFQKPSDYVYFKSTT